jgi:hypothetical protein
MRLIHLAAKKNKTFAMMTKIIIPAGLILIFSGSLALAWTNAAPNEAIFFDDPDFHGPSLTARLEPGMRQVLKPALGELNNKISSIIVGEKVKVLVFTEAEFRGAVRMYTYNIAERMPDNDQISSLIVCSREDPPQGVLFIQKRLSEIKTSSARPWHYITGQGIFFPLPESTRETESAYPHISPGWDKVRYVYVSPGIEAKLYTDPGFKGRSLSLPCPDCGPQGVFDLSTFGYLDVKKSPSGVISSVLVRAQETK